MKTDKDAFSTPADLRRKAEEKLKEKMDDAALPRGAADTKRLLHELQVHQIELEMQNEELIQSRAEAEAALAAYTDLYDFAPVGYFTLDREGTIRQANLFGARMLGVERSQLKNLYFRKNVWEEDRSVFNTFLEHVFAGRENKTCEVRLRKHRADPIWVQIEAIVAEDGRDCRVVAMDITKCRRAEEDRNMLEAELFEARKMESVGRLAGGVAHDFNNLLTAILGSSEMLADALDVNDPLFFEVNEIIKAAQNAAGLTQKLLAFSRKQIIAPKALDLNHEVERLRMMLSRLIGEDIDLVFKPAADLWRAMIDPEQIGQILVNLALNARDAMPEGGQLTIETSNVVIQGEYRASGTGPVPGEFVLLAVSDTGRGMEKEVLDKIFEPFFTTKGKDKGFGLGLSVVYGIIKQHGGSIVADSKRGRGSKFKVYLPRAMEIGEAVAEHAVLGPATVAGTGAKTVLLVEDQQMVRRLAKKILEQNGYLVLEAVDGADALLKSRKYEGVIHLLLTDVVMPNMNGGELYARLAKIRPGICVVFMSGYTDDILGQQEVQGAKTFFLQKPFKMNDLLKTVQEALLGPNPATPPET